MDNEQKALELQMKMKELSITLERVDKFSDEYWEIFDEKEGLQEEYMELRKMSDDEIQAETEETERNRDND